MRVLSIVSISPTFLTSSLHTVTSDASQYYLTNEAKKQLMEIADFECECMQVAIRRLEQAVGETDIASRVKRMESKKP